MRYAVISDIHGNLPALRVVLQHFRRLGVDRYLCAGDLVGYGPFPNECVETVAALPGVCVAGNHELMALDRLSEERCIPLACRTLRWTRTVLRDDVRDYLGSLPLAVWEDERLLLAHGSPGDPQEYVSRPEQAAVVLARMREQAPDARLLLLGHTHRPWIYSRRNGTSPPVSEPVTLSADDRWLLNPGSVGQSRDRTAWARCLLLELRDAGEWSATPYALPYDVTECRKALRRVGLPAHACHLRPFPWPAGLVRLRRLLRRMIG